MTVVILASTKRVRGVQVIPLVIVLGLSLTMNYWYIATLAAILAETWATLTLPMTIVY